MSTTKRAAAFGSRSTIAEWAAISLSPKLTHLARPRVCRRLDYPAALGLDPDAQGRSEKITPTVCRRLEISAAWAAQAEAAAGAEAAEPALSWAEAVRSCGEANLRGSGEIRGFSFEHLIRPQQERRRDRKAEGVGPV